MCEKFVVLLAVLSVGASAPINCIYDNVHGYHPIGIPGAAISIPVINPQYGNLQLNNPVFPNQQYPNQQFPTQQFPTQQRPTQQFSNQQVYNPQFGGPEFGRRQFDTTKYTGLQYGAPILVPLYIPAWFQPYYIPVTSYNIPPEPTVNVDTESVVVNGRDDTNAPQAATEAPKHDAAVGMNTNDNYETSNEVTTEGNIISAEQQIPPEVDDDVTKKTSFQITPAFVINAPSNCPPYHLNEGGICRPKFD